MPYAVSQYRHGRKKSMRLYPPPIRTNGPEQQINEAPGVHLHVSGLTDADLQPVHVMQMVCTSKHHYKPNDNSHVKNVMPVEKAVMQ